MSDGASEFTAGHGFVSWKAWQLSFVARELFEKIFLSFPEGDYKRNLQGNCLVVLHKYIIVIITDGHNG